MMPEGDQGERLVKSVLAFFLVIAGVCSLLVFLFLTYFSLPLIRSGLLWKFLAQGWEPDHHVIGIFPMIVGTVYISGAAVVMAAPVGIVLAAFIQVLAPRRLAGLLRWGVEFMAGIPTVVYGFVALFFLVPAVRGVFRYGSGLCVLSAAIMLALLILPTIVLIAQDRLAAVPESHVLAAVASGATSVETLLFVLLPGAWRGLISAVVLGAGRATGDTLIALMLAGNALALPGSPLDSARTLTAHIALVTAADSASPTF